MKGRTSKYRDTAATLRLTGDDALRFHAWTAASRAAGGAPVARCPNYPGCGYPAAACLCPKEVSL